MELASTSEYLIFLAKWIGITSFLLVAVVSALIMFFRFRLIIRTDRIARVHLDWQPVFVSCFDDSEMPLPELEERDIPTFLVLWNYFHEILRDEGKANLNRIAKKFLLDSWSRNALENGTIRERLLATQTLGWLRDKECWDKLIETMNKADPVTSLSAARALLRIDPKKAISIFIRLAAVRQDWSFATVGKHLKECGAELVTRPLINTASRLEGEELVRLLRYIDIPYSHESAPFISKLLRNSENVDVLVNCLSAVTSPDDLPKIRDLLKHDDWRVRTKAAICLGKLGTEEDIPRLIHAAGDQDWWVRHRAAISLAMLPSMTALRLKDIAESHHNLYASESITKVRQELEALQL